MSKPHLFLIESDASACRAIEMSLRDAGYTVTATTDLDVARALLEDVQPGFILADLDHTHGSGLDFCAEIRTLKAYRDVPILAMTERHDLALRVKAVDLQIFDFFKKPVLVGEIATRLRTLNNRAQYSTILRASSRSKLAGKLEVTTPYDLLTTVSRGARSAVVTCGTALGPFYCWFTEGELTDAQLGHLHGEESVHAFLGERRGNYEIEFREVRRRRSVKQSLASILEGALERIDSWNELLETLPPLSAVLRRVDGEEAAAELAEAPLVQTLSRRAEKGATVESLLRSERPRDLELAAALSKMYFYGLVEVTNDAPGAADEEDSLTSLERWDEAHGAGDSAMEMDDDDVPVREPARAAAVSTKSDLPPAPEFVPREHDEPESPAAQVDASHEPQVARSRDGGEASSPRVSEPGSYVDVDAVAASVTPDAQRRTGDEQAHVDVDHIGPPAGSHHPGQDSRLDAIRSAIRRSQLDDVDATPSPVEPNQTAESGEAPSSAGVGGGSRDVDQLAGRAEAILRARDEETLLEAHTDPYPSSDGAEADFSALNDEQEVTEPAAAMEERSRFAQSAPVLTGPLAEESMIGFSVVDGEISEPARGTARSRSESGVLRELRADSDAEVSVAASTAGAVKINHGAPNSDRPVQDIDVSHASPTGLAGRTLAESGADFDRLRTMAGIESDSVAIRSGHRPAYESVREGVPEELTEEPTEELTEETAATEADAAPRPTTQRTGTRTQVGLPPPTNVEAVEARATSPARERPPSAAASASMSDAAIPRAVEPSGLSPSASMLAMVSERPSWLARHGVWLLFGVGLIWVLVNAFDGLDANPGLDAEEAAVTTGALGAAGDGEPTAASTGQARSFATTSDVAAAPEEIIDNTTTDDGAHDPAAKGTTTADVGAAEAALGSGDADGTSDGDSGAVAGTQPGDSSSGGSSTDGSARSGSSAGGSETPAAPAAPAAPEAPEEPEQAPFAEEPASERASAAAPALEGEEAAVDRAAEYFDAAKRLFDRGKYQQAEEQLDRALALDGGWPEALLLSGKIHLEGGRFQDAMTVARRVTLVAPALVEAHIVIGVAEEALGSSEGAIAAYQRFLLVAPDHAYATSIRKELKRLGAEPSP